MFPNEASNYQLGGQFAAVASFVLDRAREKGLGRDLPAEGFAQTLPAGIRTLIIPGPMRSSQFDMMLAGTPN